MQSSHITTTVTTGILSDAYKKKTITTSTEYLLFIVDGEKYILWLKYGKIALLGNVTGMEIRSFYHCEEHQDLEKFKGKTVIEIDKHLSIVI